MNGKVPPEQLAEKTMPELAILRQPAVEVERVTFPAVRFVVDAVMNDE